MESTITENEICVMKKLIMVLNTSLCSLLLARVTDSWMSRVKIRHAVLISIDTNQSDLVLQCSFSYTLNAFIPCGTINRLTLCKCCSMFGNHFLTHLLVFVHIIFIEVIGLSNFLKYYYFILFKFEQNASLSLL